MLSLINDELTIGISPKGAELQSIFHQAHHCEYLWQGDAKYWGKRAPVLFPIVGQLKDDTYTFEGKSYHLPRHGFAREKEFEIEFSTAREATFLLRSNAESLNVFPFPFEFRLHYLLQENTLRVVCDVKNTGHSNMYFSVGGHPAFNVPLEHNLKMEDYFLELSSTEELTRYTLQKGLIHQPQLLHASNNHIPLSHELFYSDALVFKHLRSDHIALKSNKGARGLTCNMGDFPYLGIWSSKEAPFVCIEPWHGIADSTTHNNQLTEKEGIINLPSGHRWQASWQLTFF
jgi:galactose mutarotase-like enzyme